jgi:hypothetical protein
LVHRELSGQHNRTVWAHLGRLRSLDVSVLCPIV